MPQPRRPKRIRNTVQEAHYRRLAEAYKQVGWTVADFSKRSAPLEDRPARDRKRS